MRCLPLAFDPGRLAHRAPVRVLLTSQSLGCLWQTACRRHLQAGFAMIWPWERRMPTHAPGKVVGKSNGVCTSGMDIKKPVDEQYRAVTRAAALGLVVNLALGSAKLVGGLVSGSVALLSDAVNSLGDVFTSIITLIALRVAQ